MAMSGHAAEIGVTFDGGERGRYFAQMMMKTSNIVSVFSLSR
jgi:hypothetical protein